MGTFPKAATSQWKMLRSKLVSCYSCFFPVLPISVSGIIQLILHAPIQASLCPQSCSQACCLPTWALILTSHVLTTRSHPAHHGLWPGSWPDSWWAFLRLPLSPSSVSSTRSQVSLWMCLPDSAQARCDRTSLCQEYIGNDSRLDVRVLSSGLYCRRWNGLAHLFVLIHSLTC